MSDIARQPPGLVAMPALDWMWSQTALALRNVALEDYLLEHPTPKKSRDVAAPVT